MLDVGGLLRRLRRELDLNQRELAGRLSVSPAQVARWESGTRTPRVDELSASLELAGMALVAVDRDGQPVR